MISLRTKGKALNVDKNALVGKVTRNSDNLDENSFLITDSTELNIDKQFLAIIYKSFNQIIQQTSRCR